MSSIHILKAFDKTQLWRFFVDGRFQKKYNGWVGYEAGERGSIQALINGFSLMIDHFDLSAGLKGTYLRELHKVCMLSVETSNLKSSPGDIRYLNAGMPFFSKTTTLEHLVEVFEMRRDDGTAVFNNQKFSKPSNELDVKDVYAYIQREGKINYRNWYPNLDLKQTEALQGNASLHEFYQAKHTVQMLMVSKMEEIIERYNNDIKIAVSDEEKLTVIALVSREMELLHPFPDGNCRTFSCITLTHLLLFNGFMPAILKNPNLDNEVSLSQWVDEIKEGMAHTRLLLEDKQAKVFNYSILDMKQKDQQNFLQMSSSLISKIENYKEISLTPQKLQQYTGGKWLKTHNENLRFTGVGTYGTYGRGNVYFAMAIKDWIKENKDVEFELKKVLSKGMRAVVLDDMRYAQHINLPLLKVDDSFDAFKQSAIQVRQEQNPFTVLVTGTEGKTGAKVQFHHLLNSQVKTHAVLNSANTEVPVLRSLINLETDDKVEINEVSVGSDEAYRVERAVMVNPNLCFFTNIGPNHMDMHKNIENIMLAKSSVVEGLREGGMCIVNSTIENYPKLINAIYARRANTPILTYGTLSSDTAILKEQVFDSERFGWQVTADISGQSITYFLPLFQQHAPLTSVGILLAIKEMGYDVEKAAAHYQGLKPFETMGRILTLYKRSGEIGFYDQSRRGGLHGMRSAFNDMKNFNIKGRIVALVGGISIKKDSDWTQTAHAELAGMINESQIERLYTTGNFMNYVTDNLDTPSIFVKHSDNLDELATTLFSELQGGDMLFIIGSAYLYLGRVADKILRLKDKSSFDHHVYDYALTDQQLLNYKALVSLSEIEKGVSKALVLKNNMLLETDFEHFKQQHVSFIQARADLLEQFFSQLNLHVLGDEKFKLVDEDIVKTGHKAFVFDQSFCKAWFNNLDKKEDLPRKQLFGHFYYFGDAQYLLHIEVATMNLHIGFVKYMKQDECFQALKMQQTDFKEVAAKYGDFFPKPIMLQQRDWGLKWYSYDCGTYIDLTKADIYRTMVDYKNSDVYRDIIAPMLKKLSHH